MIVIIMLGTHSPNSALIAMQLPQQGGSLQRCDLRHSGVQVRAPHVGGCHFLSVLLFDPVVQYQRYSLTRRLRSMKKTLKDFFLKKLFFSPLQGISISV